MVQLLQQITLHNLILLIILKQDNILEQCNVVSEILTRIQHQKCSFFFFYAEWETVYPRGHKYKLKARLIVKCFQEDNISYEYL